MALFLKALKTRNRLIHGFFLRHNFESQTDQGRDEMLADLEAMHIQLYMAWQRADYLAAITQGVIEHELNKKNAPQH